MEKIIQLHAHDALAMIDANSGQFSLAELPQAIATAFGPSVRFYACSAKDMNSSELIRFLIERDKIVETDGKVFLNHGNICNHSH